MRRHCRIFNEIPILSEDRKIAEFQKFFMSIQKHLKVYEYFIKSAVSSSILNYHKCSPSEYYYKHIHFSNHDKFKRASNSVDGYPRNSNEEIYPTFEASSSLFTESSDDDNYYDNNPSINIPDKRFLQIMRSAGKSEIKIDKKSNKNLRKNRRIAPKRIILDRSKQKLISIFQDMCCAPSTLLKACRLTNYLFRQYLAKKFPIEMAEAISRFFDFKSANFEDYCTEIDRFLVASEDRLLSICFEAFDINKDKYICYEDTYVAIEKRTEDLYDSDLTKLNAMFEMKKKGIFPLKRTMSRKGRRMSVMSLASELSSPEERKEVPHVHPSKPEALTLEDFAKIEFKGRPQLLCNLFLYICNYDINRCQEVVTPIIKSRKQSEDIIIELSQIEDDDQEKINNEKYEYYKDLEFSMGLFPFSITKDLLDKFEVLRDKSFDRLKCISTTSMINN